MKCAETKSLFSGYLDGAVTGREMQAVAAHLQNCPECKADYAALRRTQSLVTALGPRKAPPSLALQLRVAISQEAARRRATAWIGLRVRVEDMLNAFMVPATAGLLSAVVIFGLLIGFFSLPVPLEANDVPTMLYTPPELAVAPQAVGMGSINADSVIVEALVDANGRVQDYRVLSAPREGPIPTSQLENMLIFTVFRPATSFGRPTAGRAVLSFSNINVKG